MGGQLLSDTAVLVIAHGSPDPDWNRLVEHTVRQTKLNLPVRIAFLGSVENRGIPDEVKRLERTGVRTIICVPLFVTTGSTHVSEIQYMLGVLRSTGLETSVRPISLRARIIWCPPLEDHVMVERILADRVKEMSLHPSREELLLIGHGSDLPGFRERWESLLQRLAVRLQQTFGFRAASYATLRPDTVTERASAMGRNRRLLVLPLFVSQGYFTRRVIPDRLGAALYEYSGKTYLPHPLMAQWIEQTVQEALQQQPMQ
jgi:sirohydrochlorin cobaltochelatase